MGKKTLSYICCLQEIHLKSEDTHRQKVNGWKNNNNNISSKWKGKKKSHVAILTSDKIDFITKATVRDKQYYIMIKETI